MNWVWEIWQRLTEVKAVNPPDLVQAMAQVMAVTVVPVSVVDKVAKAAKKVASTVAMTWQISREIVLVTPYPTPALSARAFSTRVQHQSRYPVVRPTATRWRQVPTISTQVTTPVTRQVQVDLQAPHLKVAHPCKFPMALCLAMALAAVTTPEKT